MANVGVAQIEEVNLGNHRLREAMLYVMRRAEDDPEFGPARLDQMLFFADASYYRSHRETITGAAYLRSPEGPSPQDAREEIRRLQKEGAVYDDSAAGCLKVLREPDLSLLSPEGTVHLDQAISAVKRMTADEAGEAIRRMPVWRWAEENAPLDFELLLSPLRVETEVSSDVREAALASARRQGLL